MKNWFRCRTGVALIANENGHIEHFLKKGRDARRTFIWSNLFYSCSTSATCGTHKDKSVNYPKDESLLINPSEENPEAFIHFSPDGEIDAVQVSAPHDQKRAQKTISVFNLNEPELVRARLNRLKMFEFLKNYSEQERAAYLDQRLADGEPFITCWQVNVNQVFESRFAHEKHRCCCANGYCSPER